LFEGSRTDYDSLTSNGVGYVRCWKKKAIFIEATLDSWSDLAFSLTAIQSGQFQGSRAKQTTNYF
jgi:hypothetical protein